MFLLLIFLFNNNIILSKDPCIYTQNYWLNNNYYLNQNSWPEIVQNQFIKTENYTQCGNTWIDLYNIDITLINKQKNILWLLLFQQYCTATLNNAKLQKFLDDNSKNPIFFDQYIINLIKDELDNLNENLVKSFSLLDQYCEKMSDLNFIETEEYTINILKNLSKINNGFIIGYCDDEYLDFNNNGNLRFDIYSLFQNNSYIDNSIFNYTTNLFPIKPLYPQILDYQNQFIAGNWVMNILIDKKFALILLILNLVLSFLLLVQIWWFYGNFIKIRRKPKDINNSEDDKHPSNLLINCYILCTRIFKCLCCCFYKYKLWKREREDYGYENFYNEDLYNIVSEEKKKENAEKEKEIEDNNPIINVKTE